MSWEPGRSRVRELIDAGEVEQVAPDLTIARRMLEDASRHLATASCCPGAGIPAALTMTGSSWIRSLKEAAGMLAAMVP
jgi:hypothetical protein